MSFNRLTFSLIIVAVLLWNDGPTAKPALLIMGAHIGLALMVLTHIVVYPAASPTRRAFALLLDTAFLSWQLHAGGETVAAFFSIYLWITFGNGFRFGLPALRLSMLLTTVGFVIVVATTPFWSEQVHLSIGLGASLVILPAYAGTLIRRLSKARSEAEQANEAKTLFLANVSHELRTPLTAIIGMGRMLHESPLDAEQKEMTETVEGAAKSLLALIDDILQISSIDAGHLPSDEADFDLLELLASVRQLVIAQATAKGLQVAIHIAPDTPFRFAGGERRLRELLINLAGNAVKFTETGGVLVAVSASEPFDGVAKLTFEVVDTGIGITAEAQSRIFDTFTQADATIINRFGGTGLGLAISKRLALSLGGDLNVESVAGRGSTFRLVAALRTADPMAPASAGTVVHVLAPDGATKTSLMQQLTAMSAVTTGFEPDAYPGPHASRPPATSGPKPVLIVCADEMGWSEPQRTEELKRLHSTAGLSIVLICSKSPADLAQLRWLCASVVVAPSLPERVSPTQLRAAVQIASARPTQPVQVLPMVGDRVLRVLVAEDNKVNQRVLRTILEKAGHDVVVVDDGEAALDMLETPDVPFDIVLMDVNMPRMDGLEATKLYRFMALGLPHLPILALTADATDQMERRCHQAGMDECLTKPVQPMRLLEVIQNLGRPGPRQPKTSGAVSHIVDHPRFRPPPPTILDDQLLQSLTDLGGEDFVAELLGQFMQEAAVVVTELNETVARAEFEAIHSRVHALQSMAANIGARALVELCTSWQALGHAELVEQAPSLASRASTELTNIERIFLARCAGREPRSPGLSR